MNRSYSKKRHIQEANIRLEQRLLNEQSSFELGKDSSINSSDNFEFSDEWFKMREKKSKISQIQDIIDNFDSIDCEGVSHSSDEALVGEIPEWNKIYCLYYQGNSKEDMMSLLDSIMNENVLEEQKNVEVVLCKDIGITDGHKFCNGTTRSKIVQIECGALGLTDPNSKGKFGGQRVVQGMCSGKDGLPIKK